MKGHSTTRVYCKSSKSHVEIDTKIVFMCKLLWELGFKTNSSCENYHDMGYVWIEFAGEQALTKFLQIVLKNEPMEDEYDVAVRALGGSNALCKDSNQHAHFRSLDLDNGLTVSYKFDMPKGGNQWGYSLAPHIFASRRSGVLQVETRASVFIPLADYNFVCSKLQQCAKRKAAKKTLNCF